MPNLSCCYSILTGVRYNLRHINTVVLHMLRVQTDPPNLITDNGSLWQCEWPPGQTPLYLCREPLLNGEIMKACQVHAEKPICALRRHTPTTQRNTTRGAVYAPIQLAGETAQERRVFDPETQISRRSSERPIIIINIIIRPWILGLACEDLSRRRRFSCFSSLLI